MRNRAKIVITKIGKILAVLGVLGSGVTKSFDFYYKRHVCAWIFVIWAILREHPLGRLTPRRVPEKKWESHRDSHSKDMSPLTQGLNYRSACDWVTTSSRDIIGHVTIWLHVPHFLLMLHCDQASISNSFEILGPKENLVTTLTFLDHVTSSVMWSFDSSSTFPIGPPLWPSPYLQPFSRYWALNIIGSRPWPF